MLIPSTNTSTLRLAIYRSSSLGDVVLATACLDLLRQLPFHTDVTWVGRGPAMDMIAKAWPQVRTVTVNNANTPIDLQKIADQLQNNHLLIDLQCNLRSQWLARNLKTLHRVPFFSADKNQLARNRLLLEARIRGRRRPLPERVQAPTKFQYMMMADALKRALRFQLPADIVAGMDRLEVRPRLPIPADLDPPWRKELRFGLWLAVAPGAAHPTKQAPLDAVLDIIESVRRGMRHETSLRSEPLGLVFLGDDKDRQSARQIMDKLSWDGPTLNLAGKLSLWETAIALSEASCLLSNDSSLGHIAEAVDTPTAVLFGPTVEAFGFAPRMKASRAFSTLVGCRPCSKHGKVACRFGDRLCFTTLRLGEVSDHLLKLLVEQNSTPTNEVVMPAERPLASSSNEGLLLL